MDINQPTEEQLKLLKDAIRKPLLQGVCYDYTTGRTMSTYTDRVEVTDNPVVLDSPFERVKGE